MPDRPPRPGLIKGTRGRIIDLLRRSGLTANEIAAQLGLTHNAVRGHLAVMLHEGLVREGGARQSATRPAVVYELVPEAEAGFSKAYIPFVAQLVRVLQARLRPSELDDIMRTAGRGLAARWPRLHGELPQRVEGAAALLDERGECGERDPLSGYYFREARHLRTLALEINAARPWLCADGSAGHDELEFVYVYPELTEFGGGGTDVSDDTTWTDSHGVTERAIDVRLRYRARLDGLDVELTLANRSAQRVALTISWVLDADFADIQEAQAGSREQRAEVCAEPCPGG